MIIKCEQLVKTYDAQSNNGLIQSNYESGKN